MSKLPQKEFTPTKEQKDAANPAQSVWVAASAGSGKTHVLVDRVIRLLLDGAAPASILCLTFTKAAAAEMSNRLFQRLSGWAGMSDEDLSATLKRLGVEDTGSATRAAARKLFARALETPGGLKIQTIHSFCERLLHLFPVESGMAPGFRVMEEQETQDLFRDALLQALEADDDFTREAFAFLDDGSVSTLEDLEKLARRFLSASSGMRHWLSDANKLAETENNLRQILQITAQHSLADITEELTRIDADAYGDVARDLMPLEADASHCVPKFLLAIVEASKPESRLELMKSMLLTQKGEARKSLLRKPARTAHPDHRGMARK